jgi:hypothetical protein
VLRTLEEDLPTRIFARRQGAGSRRIQLRRRRPAPASIGETLAVVASCLAAACGEEEMLVGFAKHGSI